MIAVLDSGICASAITQGLIRQGHLLEQPLNPLATRAVYTFTSFPGVPERHLYLHHDG